MSKKAKTAEKKEDKNFAVITTGGKQYLVKKGDIIEVDRIFEKKGSKINFDTLLKAGDKSLNLGKSRIQRGKTEGKVLEEFKDKKVRIIKFKPKKRYKRIKGFRALKTRVEITKI